MGIMRQQGHALDREAGFSLVELMVVVLIIGILVAIALPSFLGARTRAQDAAAKSLLRNGIAAAKTYFADSDSYVGFDAAGAAAAIEASIRWDPAAGPAALNTISIHVDSDTELVLDTLSASGTPFCIAEKEIPTQGQTLGRADAATYAACTGGW